MEPPEPIDISADELPSPAIVDEILTLAERAKNEPSFELPEYVPTVSTNKDRLEQQPKAA